MDEDFLLDSYSYELPENQIAQFPCGEPGTSRLLVMSRKDGRLEHARFRDIASCLPPGSLIVANNARVLQARITWKRAGGGKSEFLLLSPLPLVLENCRNAREICSARVDCLLRPAAKFRTGETLRITPELRATIVEKLDFGRHIVDLEWRGDLEQIFTSRGLLPLPPYIKRDSSMVDIDRYQTVFASRTGAVAAPTAGLHFTPELRRSLEEKNFSFCEITLYVGYGTFSPVRHKDIRQHKMHSEYVEMNAEAANAILDAKKDGRPVIALGTTSLRTVEGIFAKNGQITEFSGWTDIFIYPGFRFGIVDGLITNFHLPESSLLMLVSAFSGRKNVLHAYAKARNAGYRFFSYGDAMLIK